MIEYTHTPAIIENRAIDGLPVLLLHGWGCNRNTWGPLALDFSGKGLGVYAIDFCGFGKSPPPDEPWGTAEYADALGQWMDATTGRCHVIAHSFGGRVALQLFSRRPELAGRIIITGGAGLKPKRKAGYYVNVYSYKAAKRLASLPGLKLIFAPMVNRIREKSGSADYKAAQGIMRDVFIKAVNENLADRLPLIKAPTLLVWGNRDTETPLWMGQQMEREIPDAGLVVFENAGHFAFIEQYIRFLPIAERFFTQK